MRPGGGEVDNLGAWLTTVVARISLNMLRSRKTRNETYAPEPIIAIGSSLSIYARI